MTTTIESLHSENISALLTLYSISDNDIEKIGAFGKTVEPKIGELVDELYHWLEGQPEYAQFFSDTDMLERARNSQYLYWQTFLKAEVNEGYIEGRRQVGDTHARLGLPLVTYMASMNKAFELLSDILRTGGLEIDVQIDTLRAITKLLQFDIAIGVETYNRTENESITEQTRAFMEMSTPVTQIWNQILMLPVVGLIDSKRAKDIMDTTLAKISEVQARIFILDISGVAVVDTAVANHLIKVTKATRLMGCESIISGVSPAIAQTIVELGIDVGVVKTTANMMDALRDTFRRLGMELKERN
ncbi:MAG: rsbT co-antagonist protein RsbR [Candidatus Latescibacterota bacterium]|jgi:rsbT co-antagonist protein RsbR